MEIVKALFSVWLVTFGFLVSLCAANIEKPISLRIESLIRWKNSSEAPAIQQGLSAILKTRHNYPRITESFKGEKEYASVFRKPFLLLDAEPNDFGGFFALVVFKSYPKLLRLWIYEIDKKIFELREAVPLQVTLNKQIMKELEDKRIAPYWMTLPPP